MTSTAVARPFSTTRNLRLLLAFMALGRLQPHLAVCVWLRADRVQ